MFIFADGKCSVIVGRRCNPPFGFDHRKKKFPPGTATPWSQLVARYTRGSNMASAQKNGKLPP